MLKKKYKLPEGFPKVDQSDYERWLQRKAQSLVKRDRQWLKEQNSEKKLVIKVYKKAIHKAVCECKGVDAYTGEKLRWDLLSKWDNSRAEKEKENYKKKFVLLPVIDHAKKFGVANFKICSWRTNDAKNDLPLPEFIELCKKVYTKNLRNKIRIFAGFKS